MDRPGACLVRLTRWSTSVGTLTLGIDPICIQIRKSRLVTGMLNRLGRFLIDDAARPSPPATFGLDHVGARGQPVRASIDFRGEGDGTGD